MIHLCIFLKLYKSNFNGSNTFGTIKTSSSQGKFELMSVYHSARSGGIIGIFFCFCFSTRGYIVCSH